MIDTMAKKELSFSVKDRIITIPKSRLDPKLARQFKKDLPESKRLESPQWVKSTRSKKRVNESVVPRSKRILKQEHKEAVNVEILKYTKTEGEAYTFPNYLNVMIEKSQLEPDIDKSQKNEEKKKIKNASEDNLSNKTEITPQSEVPEVKKSKKRSKNDDLLPEKRQELVDLLISDLEKCKAIKESSIDIEKFALELESYIYSQSNQRVNKKYWKISDRVTFNLRYLSNQPFIVHRIQTKKLSSDTLLLENIKFLKNWSDLLTKKNKYDQKKRLREEKKKEDEPKTPINSTFISYTNLLYAYKDAKSKEIRPVSKLESMVKQSNDETASEALCKMVQDPSEHK